MPIRFQQVSGEAYKARMTGYGMSDASAEALVDLLAEIDQGIDNAEPRTPRSTTPTTFRQWREDVLRPAVLA